MRDAARLPPPCPSIGALPALQLIVSTRNSRPSFSLLFLKVSRHVPPPPTASAPISFAALPPDNPPTHDCLGATRDDEPSFLPRVAFADNGRLAVLTRRARQEPNPVLEGWGQMAHRYRPQPHAPGRRTALHGAEPESWTRFLFCIDAMPSPSSISDLLPTQPRFEDHPVLPPPTSRLEHSAAFPCPSTESRTQPLTDDDEDRAGGDKTVARF